MYILCLNFYFEHFSKTPSTLKVHYGAVISQQESGIKRTCSWFNVALRTLFCCSLKRLRPVKASAAADGRPVIDRRQRAPAFPPRRTFAASSWMRRGDPRPSASINNSHICGGSWKKKKKKRLASVRPAIYFAGEERRIPRQLPRVWSCSCGDSSHGISGTRRCDEVGQRFLLSTRRPLAFFIAGYTTHAGSIFETTWHEKLRSSLQLPHRARFDGIHN